MIKVKLTGRKKVDLTRYASGKRKRVVVIINKYVRLIQAKAVELIKSGPKSGRIYSRGGRKHQASAPGEAPADDTGNLAANVFVVEGTTAGTTASVVARAVYAMALEFGTKNMLPRPFMRAAYEFYKPSLVAELRDMGVAA